MFYCNGCAEKREWPITGFKSFGQCEICNKTKACNDLPSKMLPVPELEPEKETNDVYQK